MERRIVRDLDSQAGREETEKGKQEEGWWKKKG